MATQAQINANQANAKKSTGPTSDAGKAKSCMNHLSHGFTSSLAFLEFENSEDFQGLVSDLLGEFQPSTPHEQILVEKMAQNQWNSLRAIRFQNITLDATLKTGRVHKDIGLFIRYQMAAERAYHKAHAELLAAQKQREKSPIGFESQEPLSAAAAAAESPQKPPVNVEIPNRRDYNQADFRPAEYKLAEQLGISVEEFMHPA